MNVSPALCALGLSLLLLGTGCQRPEEVPQPANLLGKDEMTHLLIRLHLLEARAESSRLSPDSARALFLTQQRELLWRYHINPQDSTLERSYRYYALHNKDLDEIYTAVVDSLQVIERQQAAAQNPSQPQPK